MDNVNHHVDNVNHQFSPIYNAVLCNPACLSPSAERIWQYLCSHTEACVHENWLSLIARVLGSSSHSWKLVLCTCLLHQAIMSLNSPMATYHLSTLTNEGADTDCLLLVAGGSCRCISLASAIEADWCKQLVSWHMSYRPTCFVLCLVTGSVFSSLT